MLKLLTCTQGHYWETHTAEGADGSADSCPVCGQPAETMPLLDLAPSEAASTGEAPVAPPASSPIRDKDGRPIVAGYEILEDLGKGPTGLHLYKARQVLVNRPVVLKVVFAKEDPSQLAWGSLRGEASALGRLAHPNIVQILEAGERERQLFYNAVEYVEGPTLAKLLGGKPLPLRQAVVLVETLARVVHQAHQKNIAHRSLKPASILLAMQNAECGMQNEKQASPPFCNLQSAFCIPKITDFGLARRLVEGDASDAELQGELPCYLAPEQAWGRAKEIGPATDIYGLGAILYELIAGRPPFREATAAETLDAIQCREAPPLARRRSGVPGDLDAICRKCLAKQPRRRYASALDLAEDLRRCADGHSIKARTTGNAERLGKWLRRNARAVALVLLGLGLGAALMGLIKASHDASSSPPPSREQGFRQTISRLEADLLESRRHQSNADYLRYLLLAERAADAHERESGLELLERCPPEKRHWEWYYLRGHLQDFHQVARLTADLPISCMDISSNSRYLVAGGDGEATRNPFEGKGEVSVWDLTTRQRRWHWQMAEPVRSVRFSPNNAYVALLRGFRGQGTLEARHLQTGIEVFAPRLFTDCTPTSLAYSEDSQQLMVLGDDGQLRVLQGNNAANRKTLQTPVTPLRPRDPRGRLLPMPAPSDFFSERVAPISPDRLALISPDGNQILVWSDLQRRDVLLDFRTHDDTIYSALAYDAKHDKLAAGGTAKAILLWDMRFPYQAPRRLRGHADAVKGLSFSSDGKRLASCAADGTVRIWDAEQELELLALRGYPGVSSVRFQQMLPPFDADRSYFGDRLAIAHGNTVTILEPP